MAKKTTYLILGKKIRDGLAARDMSQADLAARIGKAQSRVSKWCAGTGAPDPVTIRIIAEALGLPLAYFCDDRLRDPSEVAQSVPGGGPGRELSEQERLLWANVERIGLETALDRLLMVTNPSGTPDRGRPPDPTPTVKPGVRTVKMPSPGPKRKP